MYLSPNKGPGTRKTPGSCIRAISRIVVLSKSLVQVFGLTAVIAASGLALEDVDVESFHNMFPDSK